MTGTGTCWRSTVADDDEVDNPFNESSVAWISMHEMFTGMVNAGFTENQAGFIIGTFLSQQVSGEEGEA